MRSVWIITASVFILLVLVQCQDDTSFSHQKADILTFSSDTVRLDTVFSAQTSSTYRLTVYNTHDERLKVEVSSPDLCQQGFNLLVDGTSLLSDAVLDLTLEPKDSVMVFISLNSAEQVEDLPVLLSGELCFTTHQTEWQRVRVEAYTQDVYLLHGASLDTAHWKGVKPYLIYNDLTINDLTIDSGVVVYLHQGANLRVRKSLTTLGTFRNPVLIRGDRMEKDYRSYPGQWGSLILEATSSHHQLSHTEIRNGTNGIWIPAGNETSGPTVSFSDCKILNMSHAGLYSQSAHIRMENSVVANGGTYTVALWGGSAVLVHCTLANNYSPYMMRHSYPLLYLEGPVSDATSDTLFAFYNTLVYGTLSNELFIGETLAQKYWFDHCLLRTTRSMKQDARFSETVLNPSFSFKDSEAEDFSLDTLSVAKNKGNLSVGATLPLDLDQHSRLSDTAPDIGAYERIE